MSTRAKPSPDRLAIQVLGCILLLGIGFIVLVGPLLRPQYDPYG